MLTAKQRELLQFITVRLEDSGISPSFEEMKEALDLKSKSGVHRLISALEERGFIRRLPNRARALEVIRQPEDSVAAPRARANDNVVPLRRPEPARGRDRTAQPPVTDTSSQDPSARPENGTKTSTSALDPGATSGLRCSP